MGKTLGEIISMRVKALGITQKKMCEDLDINPGNFSSFVKGKRGVKYHVLISMLEYLGLTFGKEGEEVSNVAIADIPSFFKECVNSTGKRVKELDLPIHSCTLVSFTTGDRMVTSTIIEKLMPIFGVTLLPYEKKED